MRVLDCLNTCALLTAGFFLVGVTKWVGAVNMSQEGVEELDMLRLGIKRELRAITKWAIIETMVTNLNENFLWVFEIMEPLFWVAVIFELF